MGLGLAFFALPQPLQGTPATDWGIDTLRLYRDILETSFCRLALRLLCFENKNISRAYLAAACELIFLRISL